MEQVRFSIVVPAYNAEDYVERCIKSVLAQPVSAEVIVVDDGSTDRTGEICDALAAKDARITVIHQPNGGLCVARNEGLRRAKGQYVAFLDSDDWYIENTLAEIERAIDENGEPDVCIGRFAESYESGELHIDDISLDASRITGKTTHEVLRYIQSIPFIYAPVRYFVKRELLLEEELFFKPGVVHEDELWTPQLLCAAKSYACVEAPFYGSTTHDGSVMNTRNFKKLRDRMDVAAILQEKQLAAEDPEIAAFYQSRVHALCYSAVTECPQFSGAETKEIAAAIAALKGFSGSAEIEGVAIDAEDVLLVDHQVDRTLRYLRSYVQKDVDASEVSTIGDFPVYRVTTGNGAEDHNE